MAETRQLLPLRESTDDLPEPTGNTFEDVVMLERIIQQAVREGMLSEAERQLLLKSKWEGFEANELVGMNAGNTTNAVQMRLKRIIKRLRRIL
jgi:DNA-directed RNA polymerase specialized sigma24 family protein